MDSVGSKFLQRWTNLLPPNSCQPHPPSEWFQDVGGDNSTSSVKGVCYIGRYGVMGRSYRDHNIPVASQNSAFSLFRTILGKKICAMFTCKKHGQHATGRVDSSTYTDQVAYSGQRGERVGSQCTQSAMHTGRRGYRACRAPLNVHHGIRGAGGGKGMLLGPTGRIASASTVKRQSRARGVPHFLGCRLTS